jgi:hypothetical protein
VEKVKVIYVHESVVSSVFKDVVTFGCLFALWFFNHRFCGGTGIIDFFVGLMVLVCAVGFSKKRHSPKEALDILTELARQDTKDTAKTSTNKPMPKPTQDCGGCYRFRNGKRYGLACPGCIRNPEVIDNYNVSASA